MSSDTKAIAQWAPSEMVVIPNGATPQEIVQFAKPQLSNRDMRAVVAAIQSESYEMLATFVWAKAASVLKKQISSLGMDFVGEMLNRTDLTEGSDPAREIADHEAIALAEDLSIVTATQAVRLKHALELVSHFTNLDVEASEQEEMMPEEAMLLLKTCVASILGHPNFQVAVRFLDFRRSLTERTLKPEDADVVAVTSAPYFFVRTILSALLGLVKTGRGAIQEHAIGNLATLVPILWPQLREQEKWQVGQAYAEVNANGDRAASSGIKKALLSVKGFDFVPETLRSSTFSRAAARVLEAHFAFNNFSNEKEPMEALANLGTAIPQPAFAKSMEATLAVWLGNRWGASWAAHDAAKRVLDTLRNEQWEYYLNECLPRDRTVLDKIAHDDGPASRWIDMVSLFKLEQRTLKHKKLKELISASANGNAAKVKTIAAQLRIAAGT